MQKRTKLGDAKLGIHTTVQINQNPNLHIMKMKSYAKYAVHVEESVQETR